MPMGNVKKEKTPEHKQSTFSAAKTCMKIGNIENHFRFARTIPFCKFVIFWIIVAVINFLAFK